MSLSIECDTLLKPQDKGSLSTEAGLLDRSFNQKPLLMTFWSWGWNFLSDLNDTQDLYGSGWRLVWISPTLIKIINYLDKSTHQSMFVWYVVGKFQFMKTDNFLHPLLPSGGTVRVDVHPLGHLGVRLPGHDPPAENRNKVIPVCPTPGRLEPWLSFRPCQ